MAFVNVFLLRLVMSNNLSTKLFCLILGRFEGMLWKKGKDNGHFLERKFVLSARDFTLKYYKEDVRRTSRQFHFNNIIKINIM